MYNVLLHHRDQLPRHRLGHHPEYSLAQTLAGMRLEHSSRLLRKQPTAVDGSGRGVFFPQQQRKEALFLLAWLGLETFGILWCIWRFSQMIWTRCARLVVIPACLPHSFTQSSLWHLTRVPYYTISWNQYMRN